MAEINQKRLYGDGEFANSENTVLGDSEANQIISEEVDFNDLLSSTQDTSLFSFSNQCPAPETFSFWGKTFEISYEPFCDFAQRVRSFVIALGYLLSGLILISYIRRVS